MAVKLELNDWIYYDYYIMSQSHSYESIGLGVLQMFV